MTDTRCNLSILVSRPDVPHLEQVVRHLVRSCNFPFARKVLTMDTAPIQGPYRLRAGIPSMEELQSVCERLISDGVIDAVQPIVYDANYRKQLYPKYIGQDTHLTHDYRGCPIYGTFYYLEETDAPYLVHFDSDVLLHQEKGFDWITRGIEVLQSDERILGVLPRSGPPLPDGSMHQFIDYEHNPNGFFEFKSFTTRLFLCDIQRFRSMLPLPALFTKARAPERQTVSSEVAVTFATQVSPKLELVETMVNEKMRNSPFIRADLDDTRAWSLHMAQRGATILPHLDSVIERVERGEFPEDQAGHYDLELSFWT